MAFATSRPQWNLVLAVSDDGSELICHKSATHLKPALLCRDQLGHQTSVELSWPKGLANYPNLIATKDQIIVFNGAEFNFYDISNLTKTGTAKISEAKLFATKFVLSKNQKYLFCNTQGNTPDGYFFNSHMLDLSDGKITWSDQSLYPGNIERIFDAPASPVVENGSVQSVANTIVESILNSPMGSPPIPDAIYSIETGVPTQIQPCLPSAYVWSDGERLITDVPGLMLSNQEKTFSFNATPPGLSIEARASAGDRMLFEQNGVLKLFNWRSMKIENTFNRIGWNLNKAVLSPNGETIALQVSHENCTWADYLSSGCANVRSKVEILDAKTGDQIRVVKPDRPFWFMFALAIGGSLMWSIAWIWLRNSGRDVHGAINDVFVVLLLWFSIALLRYVFGGWLPDSMIAFISDRPVSFAVNCLLCCLMTLISVCATFATIRWSFRLPIAVMVATLLLAVPILLWHCFDLEYGAIPLGCLFVLVNVSVVCVLTRMIGWHLSLEEKGGSDHSKLGSQSTMSDLFLFPLTIGLGIVVFSPILKDLASQGFIEDILFRYAMTSLSILLTSALALWAAFSNYEKPKWIVGTVFAICLIACMARFLFWNADAYYTIYGVNRMSQNDYYIYLTSRFLVNACGTGLCSLLALSFISRFGWKWHRRRKLIEPQEAS